MFLACRATRVRNTPDHRVLRHPELAEGSNQALLQGNDEIRMTIGIGGVIQKRRADSG